MLDDENDDFCETSSLYLENEDGTLKKITRQKYAIAHNKVIQNKKQNSDDRASNHSSRSADIYDATLDILYSQNKKKRRTEAS